MRDEQDVIYFFDDHIQLIKVADELFELYADAIYQAKFMHALVTESIFEQDEECKRFENFMKVVKGEEATETAPSKTIKHVLWLSLGENAPVEEINTCLWIGGGWVTDYDNEWYDANAIEDVTYVSDKHKVMDAYKHRMRNVIKMAGG